MADDPLRVEEGDGAACEDRLKGAAAESESFAYAGASMSLRFCQQVAVFGEKKNRPTIGTYSSWRTPLETPPSPLPASEPQECSAFQVVAEQQLRPALALSLHTSPEHCPPP